MAEGSSCCPKVAVGTRLLFDSSSPLISERLVSLLCSVALQWSVLCRLQTLNCTNNSGIKSLSCLIPLETFSCGSTGSCAQLSWWTDFESVSGARLNWHFWTILLKCISALCKIKPLGKYLQIWSCLGKTAWMLRWEVLTALCLEPVQPHLRHHVLLRTPPCKREIDKLEQIYQKST